MQVRDDRERGREQENGGGEGRDWRRKKKGKVGEKRHL